MKVMGANFAKKVEINNTGKNIVLGYTDKSGKFRVIRVDKDLEVWERITEENKFKFGPSMGWGFLGAVILGPIGAIAGILLKGRAKQCTVACVFTESRRCAIEMSPEEFTTFQFAAPAGSDVESIRGSKTRRDGRSRRSCRKRSRSECGHCGRDSAEAKTALRCRGSN